MVRRLLGVTFVSVVLCVLGSASPPQSTPSQKAAEDFRSALVKLDEDYRKELEPLKAEYIKALNEARKTALEKNDLAESQRIVAATKALETAVSPVQVAAVRHRLAGTTWEWEPGKTTLTLKADGTVASSWMTDATGRWTVNPDLTVVLWSSGHPFVTVMKFNENYTAHESYVPKMDLPRAGKRIK